MSTAAVSIDPKATLIDNLRRVGGMYVNDLAHIPAEKLGESPMGAARTPLDFTAECAGFNYYVASTLKGEQITRTQEERDAFRNSIDSFDKAKQALEASVENLADTVSNSTHEDLAKEVVTPWGEPTTAHRLAIMCVMHMMYHDGQINYIQALYGDAENHWA
ncbi:MAG: DinB family protein [Fimbriimonadaceae bacterium]